MFISMLLTHIRTQNSTETQLVDGIYNACGYSLAAISIPVSTDNETS